LKALKKRRDFSDVVGVFVVLSVLVGVEAPCFDVVLVEKHQLRDVSTSVFEVDDVLMISAVAVFEALGHHPERDVGLVEAVVNALFVASEGF
jgi:hypothetical protein